MQRLQKLIPAVLLIGLWLSSCETPSQGTREGNESPKPAAAAPKPKPNIVIFFADDLGYADVGVHGCKDVPTPNIDSIANNGVRMTDGYVSCPVCAPTRAGMLTGRYQQRFGFEHNPGPKNRAAEDFGLPREEKMLAEYLKEAGYATGMFGKWHLGYREGFRPHERGFDTFFGFLAGAHGYMPGGQRWAGIVRGDEAVDEKEYLTTALGREAAAFVEANRERPFLLYLPFNAVHTPLQAPEEDLERFPELAGKKRRRTYAAMLASMDDAIGRVLSKLRECELEERTLVIFLSDNGGPTRATTSRNAPLRGAKGQVLEGGIRVPFMLQWKGRLTAGTVYEQMVSSLDILPTVLAAAGAELPAETKVDGVNLLPYLEGKTDGPPHRALFWRFGPQAAVRQGDYKLLRQRGKPWQLFDLSKDIGESKDLLAEMPETARVLEATYEAWNKEMIPARWKRTARRRQGQRQGRRGITFKQLDKNGDGKLSKDEVASRRVLQRADADKDGVITQEEFRTFARQRRRNRR